MLFGKCGRKFVLPNCVGFLKIYGTVIAVGIAMLPKEKCVGQLERIEKFKILSNLAHDLKEIP